MFDWETDTLIDLIIDCVQANQLHYIWFHNQEIQEIQEIQLHQLTESISYNDNFHLLTNVSTISK